METPQKDIHELTLMLLAALHASKSSDEEQDEKVCEAHNHLERHLLNYLALMRKRPLLHAYEYLIPPNGQACGWYWRHAKASPGDWINWHGPFTSRKAAIEDRLRQKGAPRTPLDILERDIFTS